MPPKAAAKTQRKGAVSGSNIQDACSICYQKIGPKDDALFCSGACQKHLHRYCASVSELSFKALTSSDAPPFRCFCCYRTKKDEEIAKLQSIVELLQDEISSLKKSKQNDGQSVSKVWHRSEQISHPSTEADFSAVFDSSNIPPSTESGEPTSRSVSNTSQSPKPMSTASYDHDSKYNVVLYGVEECHLGLSRSARLESDLSSVVSVFSALDSSIQSHSVRDCFRLGKCSPDATRPRPILAKFVRVADVSKIFSKKSHLSTPFFIKPDLSRFERFLQSILMQERWKLIQSGVSRKSIRIRGNSLFVSSKLHGRVTESKFEHASAGTDTPDLSQPDSPRPTTPAVHQPHLHVHTSASDKPTTSLVSNTCPQDTSSTSIDTGATLATPPPLSPPAANLSSQS